MTAHNPERVDALFALLKLANAATPRDAKAVDVVLEELHAELIQLGADLDLAAEVDAIVSRAADGERI